MTDEHRQRLELDIREHCDRQDYAAAATSAVKGYGGELYGFLAGMCSSEADAADMFSQVCEAIWRQLRGFCWECSCRTWIYAIARNQIRHMRRTAARRRNREVPATDSAFAGLVNSVRTSTAAFVATEAKTRLQALRDALPEEDRMLLVLRVDRRLEWNELARVFYQQEIPSVLDPETVQRRAARLRKRFQLVKEGLRTAAKREGLVE